MEFQIGGGLALHATISIFFDKIRGVEIKTEYHHVIYDFLRGCGICILCLTRLGIQGTRDLLILFVVCNGL